MVYGKTQTTFQLLTEETAIKWRLPVDGAPSTAAIKAGMLVILDSSSKIQKCQPYGGSAPIAASTSMIGVAMDEYSSTLDESQGSGNLTVILGPHVGRTTQYTAADFTASTAKGSAAYTPGASDTAGYWGSDSSNTIQKGFILDCDGYAVTYYFKGA